MSGIRFNSADRKLLAILALSGPLISGPAQSQDETIDFGAFPAGTRMSDALVDEGISSITSTNPAGPQIWELFTGTNEETRFLVGSAVPEIWPQNAFQPMTINFASPVALDLVEAVGVTNSGIILDAVDSNNNIVCRRSDLPPYPHPPYTHFNYNHVFPFSFNGCGSEIVQLNIRQRNYGQHGFGYGLRTLSYTRQCSAPPAGMTYWARFDQAIAEPDAIAGVSFETPQTAATLVELAVTDMAGHHGNFARLNTQNGRIYVARPTQGAPSPFGLGRRDFTIDAWVRIPAAVWARGAALIDTRLERESGVAGRGLFLGVSNGQPLLAIADGPNLFYTVADVHLSPDVWHHIAVTVDRNVQSGGIIYLDGRPAPIGWAERHSVDLQGNHTRVSVPSIAPLSFDPTSVQADIGRRNHLLVGFETEVRSGNHGGGFDIDEIGFFSRALTPMEVGTLASLPKCR